MAGSVVTNRRSADVAKQEGSEQLEAYHAADYMVYAELQLARDADGSPEELAAAVTAAANMPFPGPYAQGGDAGALSRSSAATGPPIAAVPADQGQFPFTWSLMTGTSLAVLGAARTGERRGGG